MSEIVPDNLIEQCREGNEAAFRAVYYRTVDRVHGWVARFLGSDPDAKDVVQEVYLQVHRSIAHFRWEASFATWLHRITLNVTCSYLRRATRARNASPPAPVALDEEARLVARAEIRRLYEAMDRLSPEQRAAFALYELEGLSLQEIADLVGSSVPTVGSRLRRARIAVAKAFADSMAEGQRAQKGRSG